MKKVTIGLPLLILALLFSTQAFGATLRTDSNPPATTKVGTPASIAVCPIPGGPINCGSKAVPINGCGHCGVGYEGFMSNCTYPGIYFAMDIGGRELQDVILPSVNGATIEWTWYDETNRSSNQAIQRFSGTNTSTGEKYWIQFHHSDPGSGNKGSHQSGETGTRICGNGCGMGHIHVEFAKVDPSGSNTWVDAPNYFCK